MSVWPWPLTKNDRYTSDSNKRYNTNIQLNFHLCVFLETLDTAKQKATELRDKAGQKAIEVREKATEYRGKAAAYYERAEERAAEVRAKAGENLEKVNDVVNKLFLTDKEEYKHMKAIAGVVAGIVAGGILYMLLYFFYHVNELIALYITLPCTAILCLGLALWTPFRAVVILGMYTETHLLFSRTLLFMKFAKV